MAIWELNSLLQSHRSNSLVKDGKVSDYERFEQLLLEHLPEQAKRIKKEELQVHRKVEKLSNPTLTFKDKRSEEHTSELQSRPHLVCRLLLEKKNNKKQQHEKQ